jgi:hypothetical protein
MDEIRNYEWTNVTWISDVSINPCVKYVSNTQYQFMERMNYEWTNMLTLQQTLYVKWFH